MAEKPARDNEITSWDDTLKAFLEAWQVKIESKFLLNILAAKARSIAT